MFAFIFVFLIFLSSFFIIFPSIRLARKSVYKKPPNSVYYKHPYMIHKTDICIRPISLLLPFPPFFLFSFHYLLYYLHNCLRRVIPSSSSCDSPLFATRTLAIWAYLSRLADLERWRLGLVKGRESEESTLDVKYVFLWYYMVKYVIPYFSLLFLSLPFFALSVFYSFSFFPPPVSF